ncbi:MAG: ABC transporter ATP-binding protein [Sphingomonadaceae bacterium]|nr:ABC transporter ATP-binding protein [Sphingomonadaceae bacterium]
MGDAAIEVKGLAKAYGPVRAVAGVDLRIDEGEIFALLGPNGAGKTTTVEILEGFTMRDAGEVRVLGHDPATNLPGVKARIGIVAQETAADPFLTVEEMARMIAGTYPKPRPVDEVIELVGLGEKRRTRAGRLSGGQQRRLDVALALVGDPDLLFLDEPTTGFDPDARLEAWAMVRNLRTLGKTVLLTTHYMDEAQQLADRVAVIAGGRIIAEGTPDTLGNRAAAASRIRFRRPEGAALPDEIAARAVDAAPGIVLLQADDPVPLLNRLTGWAMEQGVALDGLEVVRPSLEETYLELIARDGAARAGGAS